MRSSSQGDKYHVEFVCCARERERESYASCVSCVIVISTCDLVPCAVGYTLIMIVNIMSINTRYIVKHRILRLTQ